MFSDNIGSAYQIGNGYGSSFNAINANVNSTLRLNDHNNAQNIPYPIQTSWLSNHSTAGPSNKTSVNQGPANTSAGLDVGGAYFSDSGLLDFNNFDDGVVDHSTNLFGAGKQSKMGTEASTECSRTHSRKNSSMGKAAGTFLGIDGKTFNNGEGGFYRVLQNTQQREQQYGKCY